MVKVCFHIDENVKWDLLLGNVHNLVQALETEAFHIEVLANSEAVRFYVRDPQNSYLAPMKELAERGVLFAVCNNALKKFAIDPKQLAEFVTVVPVGVLELIQRQEEGYAYIKP